MSTQIVPIAAPHPTEYSDEQVKLIRDTIAKGATDDEFKLFMYRAKNMGLDPLKPGQIHFVKYGTGPGTIIVGIDGMRSRAARTGKHEGTKRGVLRDDKGKCIGAWADVYRAGWREPAHEEVSLAEYMSTKPNWVKMPETMIKKVAEAATLRIAFPDELGGTYIPEEMDQADAKPLTVKEPVQLTPPSDFAPDEDSAVPSAPVGGDYIVPIGKKYRGQRLKDIPPHDLRGFVEWLMNSAEQKGEPLSGAAAEFVDAAEAYLASLNEG